MKNRFLKSVVLILVLSSFCVATTFAESSIGLYAGYDFNAGSKFPEKTEKSIQDHVNNRGEQLEKEMYNGAGFGFSYRYGLSSVSIPAIRGFGVATDINFLLNNGSSYTLQKEDTIIASAAVKYSSLEFSLLASYEKCFKMFYICADIGPNICVPCQVKFKTDATDGCFIEKKDFTRVIFGVSFGVTTGVKIQNLLVFAKVNYLLDTMSLDIDGVARLIRRDMFVSAGVKYYFRKNSKRITNLSFN